MVEDKTQGVLNDIRGKIERERRLIQGFQSLKRITDNAEVIQRCNNQIRETQSNIDYLQETMAKVSLQQNDTTYDSPSKPESSEPTPKPLYSRFDLIKYDCPSLGHRILYMLQQLQFKLQVENQYREANQKISHLYRLDGDKSSSDAADSGRVESDQRIHLLNKSLKRYQDMHIDVEEVTRDMDVMNVPKYARKPLSGKLIVGVTCVRDIDHIASPMFSKRPETLVAIKVDDVEKARTRGSRSGKWNEEFHIDIDKGNEIEFSVYDKSGNSSTLVAITWALLSDIIEEIRKRKVAQEVGSSGWISASNLPNNFGKASNENLSGSTAISSTTNSISNMNSHSAVTTSSGPDSSTPTSASTSKNVQINTWLNLEPVGQILVSLSFEKSYQTGGKQFMGALGRHGAIRQKKEEVFQQHGHQFVQKQFYNIMCCAFCGEFLRYTGFQCQDCRFLCHKKCFQKVVTKCISKSSTEIDPDEAKLNHSIPHRFEPVTNRGTKWCCHCGYILPWGRKNVRKCTECGVMCHAYCTHLVPDFCGMSMEMANKILTTIKSTKVPPKPSPTRLPVNITSDNDIKPGLHHPDMIIGTKTNILPVSSDEEEEQDEKGYGNKLPTRTSNQYQEATDSPVKVAGRRPPRPMPEEYQDMDSQLSRKEPHPYDVKLRSSIPLANPEYANRQSENHATQINPFEHPADSDQRDDSDAMPMDVDPDTSFQQGVSHSTTHDDLSNAQHEVQLHAQQQVQQDQQLQAVQPKASPHKSKKRRRKVGLDDFQFLAVLGKGNFGKVMLAESRHTQKLCAIKVLKKDFIVENDEADSVRSEKRVYLTANKEMHPFLLNLHCCFQTENRIYFVMEYISGGDLMWHIQKSRFSARRAKFYACEVLLGLKYFHDNGIVYRDLKLDNILLTTKGHIKIADYGLCKEDMWYGNTTGTFCGTPEFMAPEIITGKQYDRSVDWWAFGVLLFQMLLCQSPFKGDDEDEIFNAIEHDDVRYPISMPRQTVLVLQALLTKDPARRLGASQRDAEEVMEHPYFLDVNFDDVFSFNTQVPYLPEVTSEHDYSNFDQEFTSETPRLTPVETVLTSEMQEQFRGFSYISENAAI